MNVEQEMREGSREGDGMRKSGESSNPTKSKSFFFFFFFLSL